MESKEQQSTPEGLQKKPLRRMMMLRFAGLGDDLFVNTIAYHLCKQEGRRVVVAGRHPELFRGNPGAWIIPTRSQKVAHQVGRLLLKLRIIDSMTYMGYQPDEEEGGMRPMKSHIFKVLSDRVDLKNAPKKPEIFLTPEEKKCCALPTGSKPWIAIHSTGVTEMTENKNWYPKRFMELSKRLRDTFRVVQLGRKSDPLLEVDLDLRGKVHPREAAAVLASCSGLVCQVGYLMHAAAAVGTRAVVIYGGFEAPWESGYEQNINLFTKLPCSPCWLREPCPYDKECMKQISVDDVLNSVSLALN
jgi:hypothetical protein